MKITKDTEELFELVSQKSSLKTSVYNNTHQAFNIVKETIRELSKEYNHYHKSNGSMAPLETKHKGKFEIDLKFGGDILLFMMHTNVFEFPRQHEIMKTPYVKDDPTRSYCGIINIYNFIADSFKYHRVNDIGYLIGRIFINKENHYFIENGRWNEYLDADNQPKDFPLPGTSSYHIFLGLAEVIRWQQSHSDFTL